ncbi:MAG: SUMF1/EgtB/PvdO family nonheme iron enzyme, partial [Acidobacteriota bacterium]
AAPRPAVKAAPAAGGEAAPSSRAVWYLAAAGVAALVVVVLVARSGSGSGSRESGANSARRETKAVEPVATKPEKSAASSAEIRWVQLPGGSFEMGSNRGGDDEKPRHRVTLSGFEMAKSETTVAQYAACVDAGKCTAPDQEGSCNWGKSDRGEHPVNCVDWEQAKAFCEWAGARLPTEAEWEYAARSGGKDQEYPWGDQAPSCDRAVMNEGGLGCGKETTWPVCSKPSGNTEQGACDLAGNVWEWVADWYDDGYYRKSSKKDPKGPAGGSSRVDRGGGWSDGDAGYLRASNRGRVGPGGRLVDLGFRCARPR